MPVDWSQSRTRSLHLPVLNVEDKPSEDDVNLEESDDEELREQMDMHSIIVPCINDEPFLTAEQVIEEIEEMMQDSMDMQAEQNPLQTDLIHRSTSHSFEESKCQNTGLIMVLSDIYSVSISIMVMLWSVKYVLLLLPD
ncbi:fasciculation and elongation protein zeta-2-like [Silurus meridionalis]|uniref:fasciculation and elongation protein zeta-2-like n=1 Tax=Silurus meridionalis TaxID=175797 RepID=UPI001EEC1CB1|nr:fasciculation and elongation protein zeta-2-like [Silurus meridionalis]